METKKREEQDSLGTIKVDADKLWGAQTQRSLENFRITSELMPMEVISAIAQIKKAAAKTNAKLKKLSEDKAELIAQVCDEILKRKLDEHFPLVVWQTGSGTQTNMNVNEVIANRAQILKTETLDGEHFLHPNDDVNLSQSSNDVFPSAMHIGLRVLLQEETLPALDLLQQAFEEKSKTFHKIVKIGRTHTMDATPLTLGQTFSAFAAQIAQGKLHLIQSLTDLSELALGGTAVGTGLNTPAGFAQEACAQISEQTGFPFVDAPNKFAALSSHSAIIATHGALKEIAVALMKIGNDIRMLASGPRCGIGELSLPANEPGSSIMPGKVNPTQVEALTMAMAEVCGNDTAVTIGGMMGHFELNVFKPLLAFNSLRSAHLIADSCTSFAKNCVCGIEANESKISEHLNQSLMLVTALSPHIGYDKAAEIAKKALGENTTLKEAALELGYVSARDFDLWVDPRKMIPN